jgi:hypothetical protein
VTTNNLSPSLIDPGSLVLYSHELPAFARRAGAMSRKAFSLASGVSRIHDNKKSTKSAFVLMLVWQSLDLLFSQVVVFFILSVSKSDIVLIMSGAASRIKLMAPLL